MNGLFWRVFHQAGFSFTVALGPAALHTAPELMMARGAGLAAAVSLPRGGGLQVLAVRPPGIPPRPPAQDRAGGSHAEQGPATIAHPEGRWLASGCPPGPRGPGHPRLRPASNRKAQLPPPRAPPGRAGSGTCCQVAVSGSYGLRSRVRRLVASGVRVAGRSLPERQALASGASRLP